MNTHEKIVTTYSIFLGGMSYQISHVLLEKTLSRVSNKNMTEMEDKMRGLDFHGTLELMSRVVIQHMKYVFSDISEGYGKIHIICYVINSALQIGWTFMKNEFF